MVHLRGINYDKGCLFAAGLGFKPASPHRFGQATAKIRDILASLVLLSIYRALKSETEGFVNNFQEQINQIKQYHLPGNSVVISPLIWRDLGMGNVTFLSLKTKKIIADSPLINRSQYQNFDGKVKAMEGHGTQLCCETLAEMGYTLVTFPRDGDSSSFSAVKSVFPNCKEKSCRNSCCKRKNENISLPKYSIVVF